MRRFLIWKDFAIYSGPSFFTKRHSHFFAQLCIANGKELRLRGKNGIWRSYKAAFIPSGISHETETADGHFTLILMDPVVFGSFFPERIPKEGDPAADIADMISEKDIQFLLSTFESNPSNVKEEWFRILSKQGRAISGRERNIINDVRISDSIKLLSESEEDVSLSILSRKAGLSPSRFRHLFREETGITFSGYKLWLKTQKAIFSLRDRLELTTAAYEGGFSDQAHFSRIFRRSFGISPSDFAKKPDRFHVRFFFS